MKNYKENQLIKNKMDLNNRKLENPHPPTNIRVDWFILHTKYKNINCNYYVSNNNIVENYRVISLKGYVVSNVSCVHVVALSEKSKYQIQYGYRKCVTHARVFSQTVEHGNGKNEIRQINRRRYEVRREDSKK